MPQSPPAARPERSAARRLTTRAVRAGTVVLRVLYVGTALLGLLVTPPVVLVLVPVLTVTAVLLLAGFIWYVQEQWPSRRTLTTVAAGTAALLPFGHAVDALQEVGTALGLAVLGLLAVVSVARAASGPAVCEAAQGDDPSLRELLRVVPLETLLSEWRALGGQPADRRSSDSAGAAQVSRRLLLDELERRDPVGFADWFASGTTSPPDEHVRDDRGLPA